jgi:hypothetical protein
MRRSNWYTGDRQFTKGIRPASLPSETACFFPLAASWQGTSFDVSRISSEAFWRGPRAAYYCGAPGSSRKSGAYGAGRVGDTSPRTVSALWDAIRTRTQRTGRKYARISQGDV